jgi:two-component system CheB/CheR fusion protein
VVGVGASAGGLDAFTQLLQALPDDTGLAFVFIQHLAPQRESALPELLAGKTRLPVVQAADHLPLEPNRVYVIPPNWHMELRQGMLRLFPRQAGRAAFLPIDRFFRSLAEEIQSRAIGVILSGTASDGALGLREIKAAGGITFAQDPETARYDGMPRAAIATHAVDLTLAPPAIAAELARISRHPYIMHVQPRKPGDEVPVHAEQLREILEMLKRFSGVNFTNYKQPTIRRRLQRRMMLHKLGHVDHYLKYLRENPGEIRNLYRDVLIHVTRFFREPGSFQALADTVFPEIVKNRRRETPIRIWVPGCSTGEEPYSLAIALLEFLGDEAGEVPIQIFGTDLSEPAIEAARAGLYPETIEEDVSPERLHRFFTKTGDGYRICKTVRDLCVFARQDLTRDPPFSKLDLIVCRNVMIYLGQVLQKRLVTVFHYALKPLGFLVLGEAETVGAQADLFAVANKRHRIYYKKAVHARTEPSYGPASPSPAETPTPPEHPAEIRGTGPIQAEANRIILSRYSPGGVIVDKDSQILEFRGQTGCFLEPAPGDASLNLLKMAREGLLYPLRISLHESRKNDAPVTKEGLRVKLDGTTRHVDLHVIPLGGGDERYSLVLFEDVTERLPRAEPKFRTAARPRGRASPQGHEQQVLQLQQELAANREYLQSIIQELEAANEAMQSANEEILSSNEELQSTNEELDTAKEELQSSNRESNALNEELHERNAELIRVNSDLINLLSSVQIAIVMVDGDLRIRRFTPMAEKILNLISTDIGRPISHIKPNIDCPDLEQLITEVVNTVSLQEREVQDQQGRRYLLRIRPYKNLENRIDGAVLALLDRDSAKALPPQSPRGPADPPSIQEALH